MLDWAQLETNPYLRDNACPIEEEMDVAECEVIGEIPPQLSGAFMRNGSNQQFEPRGPYHLFDGDGMLHSISFGGGEAQYHNRFVRTDGFLAEREEALGSVDHTGVNGRAASAVAEVRGELRSVRASVSTDPAITHRARSSDVSAVAN